MFRLYIFPTKERFVLFMPNPSIRTPPVPELQKRYHNIRADLRTFDVCRDCKGTNFNVGAPNCKDAVTMN